MIHRRIRPGRRERRVHVKPIGPHVATCREAHDEFPRHAIRRNVIGFHAGIIIAVTPEYKTIAPWRETREHHVEVIIQA